MTRAVGPHIGWYMLSEADRAATHRYLSKLTSDGTRDELGFAPVHFAFADRFFPGTSVQHAELRYVFFVAWSYQELLQRTAGGPFPREALCQVEWRYSRRLMDSVERLENSGISGWMKYRADQRPVVRASTIYWTALRSWRLVQAPEVLAEPPTEVQVQGLWPHLLLREDGERGRASPVQLFLGMPAPPAGWDAKSGELGFTLRDEEAHYLRQKWAGPDPSSEPLMSKLTRKGVAPSSLWSKSVRSVANEDEARCLTLSQQAASIACVSRAVYAALIEAARNDDLDQRDTVHSEAVPELVDQHRDRALALDVDQLRAATAIDHRLAQFMRKVQDWIRSDEPYEAFHATVADREHELKAGRAFLTNEERRVEWRKAVAEPLDYRWPTVRHMIERVLEVA